MCCSETGIRCAHVYMLALQVRSCVVGLKHNLPSAADRHHGFLASLTRRHAACVMIGGLADLCKHRLPQDGVGEGGVLKQGARQDLSRQILPSVVAHAEVQDLVRHCIGLRCNYHT